MKQNSYPLWKYLLLVFIALVSLIYAIPNFYGEDPAIQISPENRDITITENTAARVQIALDEAKIPVKSIVQDEDILIRFLNTDNQLAAQDVIKRQLGHDYVVAMNLAPVTPAWLTAIGATPMKQGLDLRGGVHFLLQVDVDSVIHRRLEGVVRGLGEEFRNQRLRYSGMKINDNKIIQLSYRQAEERDLAYNYLRQNYQNLELERTDENRSFIIYAQINPAEIESIRQYTIEQTMTILRNRVNELGVGDAEVQQQGATRVAVNLPGIQDSARASQILGGTATLEFHMVDEENSATTARESGIVPAGTKLHDYDGRPVLLNRQIILSGDSITSAVSSYDQQSASPSVNIQLGGGGESLFSRTTRANIGKRMAIVYVESKIRTQEINGEIIQLPPRKEERVISVATIQNALGTNFQITGLSDPEEARNLALLLRAGALPATIFPVEERTIGPSLGQENIERGMISLLAGMLIILVLMVAYYRTFGLFANVALLLNLLFIIAILSLLDATLTLPGIAGIVLTIGMAVDANVLINERIREELRNGATPQAAIYAGYERAFSTIVDANITTLIVAIVLFAVGTGPVRGFAVTLSIGILTSMLTAIAYTRAIVNLYYGRKSVKSLSIGI